MKFHMIQTGSTAFFILIFMMGPKLYAYPPSSTDERSLNGGTTAAGPIETETELPFLVFAEDAGNSFLARVFSALLLAEEHESTQVLETATSPKKLELLTPEKELTTASPEQNGSNSALRSILFYGALGISWGLIALLALRLLALRQKKSEQSIEAETITSTGYQILGDIAAENRKFQLAEQCYRKIAEKESYNKEIHYEIGKALFQAKHYQEAIKEFQIALGSEIISTDIYGFLAKAYQAIGQPERAAQYSRKALQFPHPTPVAPRKKETRNVIPLQKRLKSPKVTRSAQKLSA